MSKNTRGYKIVHDSSLDLEELKQKSPFVTKVVPEKTTEEPVEDPEKTSEEPKKTTEVPKKTTEEPVEDPEKTSEEPKKTTEVPKKTTEEPALSGVSGTHRCLKRERDPQSDETLEEERVKRSNSNEHDPMEGIDESPGNPSDEKTPTQGETSQRLYEGKSAFEPKPVPVTEKKPTAKKEKKLDSVPSELKKEAAAVTDDADSDPESAKQRVENLQEILRLLRFMKGN